MNVPPKLVSVHGGHSGQFCNHASNTLEEMVKRYIQLGFSWVGISEHTPPNCEKFLYPEEKERDLTPELLLRRFNDYTAECRRLQEKYRSQLEIYVAMEIETYSGYETLVPFLIKSFQPDYIVGSVHHIYDISFDYSKEDYLKAVEKAGSLEQMYCDYFDAQFAMIRLFTPAVVGHFDLIRLYDDNYAKTLENPAVQEKIYRNLQLIKRRDLILDFNLRSLLKGAGEPYISRPILKMARDLQIAVVPGDDSHDVSSVGCGMDTGIMILQELGMSTEWKKPASSTY